MSFWTVFAFVATQLTGWVTIYFALRKEVRDAYRSFHEDEVNALKEQNNLLKMLVDEETIERIKARIPELEARVKTLRKEGDEKEETLQQALDELDELQMQLEGKDEIINRMDAEEISDWAGGAMAFLRTQPAMRPGMVNLSTVRGGPMWRDSESGEMITPPQTSPNIGPGGTITDSTVDAED